MICDGERDPADLPSLTHDDRERHHKADSMFIENREIELCGTLGLLGIGQRADAQKKREPPSVAAMAFDFIVVSSLWLSVECIPGAVAVSSLFCQCVRSAGRRSGLSAFVEQFRLRCSLTTEATAIASPFCPAWKVNGTVATLCLTICTHPTGMPWTLTRFSIL